MADYKGLTIKFSGDTTELTKALEEVKSTSDQTQKALEHIGFGAQAGYTMMYAGKTLTDFGDKIARFGAKLSVASIAILITKGRQLIKETEEFGNKIAQVGGYLQVSGKSLDYMRTLALKFGKDTIFSATEAAEAISELAKAGMDSAQIAGGALDATLQLAAAGQMEFGEAAKVTAQAIKAFRLEAEDATGVADALAGAASNSVATVEGLAEGFTYAASWARNAGWSIQEVSGALGLLADYGIEAEMAGTALRNFLLRLAAPTGAAATAMEELGIEVRDSEGHMKSAVEIVDELNIAMAGLGDDERDALIKTIFGVRGANAALALMDAGSQELQKYIGYTNDLGAAQRMAQAQLGDLGWALELMRGEAETAAVNFGEVLTPTLIELANTVEQLASWFNELDDAEREQIVRMALLAIGTGPFLAVAGKLISVIGSITTGLGAAILGGSAFIRALAEGEGAVTGLASAIASVKFIETGEAAAQAAAALDVLAVGLTGLVIVAAGATLWKLTEGWRKAREEARRFAERTERLDDVVGDLSRTAEQTYPTIERTATAYSRVGEAADISAKHIDALADSHEQLAESMESRNKAAQATIDTLTTAKKFIHDYAGEVHLEAEEYAKLQWALDVVNQETGRNYELLYAYSGVVGENGEAVENLTESLDELIDARIREAQAAAISANLTDAYKEQYELERSKVELDRVLAAKRAQLSELEADMANGFYDYNSASYAAALRRRDELNADIAELEQSVEGVDGMMRDNAATIDFYTQKYAELVGEIDSVDEALAQLLHTAGADVFGQLGDRADEFGQRMLDAGVSSEQFANFTASQWEALVTALNADGYKMEDMLALVTGDLDLASQDWRTTLEKWAADNGVTTDVAMAAISQGIENGQVDVNHGLQGVLDSSVGLLHEFASNDAPKEGKEITEGVADGMISSAAISAVREAATRVTSTASGELGILGGMTKTYGFEAIKNFADGMDSANYLVGNAAFRAAQAAKDYIGHSIPKKGPLRYERQWGQHLIQNIVSGMESELGSLSDASLMAADAIAGGFNDQSLYMSAGNGHSQVTVINIDGMRVNDDIGIRQNVIDFAYALKAKERGYVG